MRTTFDLFFVVSAVLTPHRIYAVVNGVPVSINDASWVLALKHEKTDALVCTAALLVDASWAITAAQCVENYGIHDVLLVLAGIDKLENSEKAQKAYVMYWLIHPCYVKENSFDIALMKLSISVTSGTPIALVKSEWHSDISRNCTSVGWGYIAGENSVSNDKKRILLKTNITAVHGPTGCPCTLRQDQSRLLCSTKGGLGLCKGDFGGVLVCNGLAVAVAQKLVRTSCSDDPVLNCRENTAISSYVYLFPYYRWIGRYIEIPPPTRSGQWTFLPSETFIIWTGIVFRTLHWLQ